MAASYHVQQRGENSFAVVDSNKKIVHWTNSRRRATKVVKQLKSRSRKTNK